MSERFTILIINTPIHVPSESAWTTKWVVLSRTLSNF